MENNNNVIIKYITYTPSHKKASLKYYNKNKDKLLMKAKERHHILATTDLNFKKHRAEIAKKYYHHKKEKLMTLLKEQQENNEQI